MQSKQQRVAAIRELAMAETPNHESLERILVDHVDRDYPVGEIAEALDGGKWRYIVTQSGSAIEVACVDDLMSAYRASFEELQRQAGSLKIQDMDNPTPLEQVLQGRVRTKVARTAMAHSLGAIKAARFLLPAEAGELDADEDIKRLLETHGFQWNGGDIVQETWSEDHENRYLQSIREFQARTAASV